MDSAEFHCHAPTARTNHKLQSHITHAKLSMDGCFVVHHMVTHSHVYRFA